MLLRNMLRLVLSATALALLCHAAGNELSFTGNLERVGRRALTIKLEDRRLIEARLPLEAKFSPEALARSFHFGDRVHIAARQISALWDDETSRFDTLDLVEIRMLEHATPKDGEFVLASRPFKEPNLLPRPAELTNEGAAESNPNDPQAQGLVGPMDAEVRAKLEHARTVNLAYAAQMPNFVADEVENRETARGDSWPFTHLDTIESEVTFQQEKAIRQNVRRNGQLWREPYSALPGFKPLGAFATELIPLFDPHCPTTINYQGTEDVRGRHLLVFRFDAPPDGCGGNFIFGYQRYNPARTGLVYLDDPSGNVFKLEEETPTFPREFPVAYRKEDEFWDEIDVAGSPHILPIEADFDVRFAAGDKLHVTLEYRNHRHFEASSNITIHQ